LHYVNVYVGLEIDSEKVETKQLFDKRKVENNSIDYQLSIDSSNLVCMYIS